VADVHALLERGKDTVDALAALFPGGSITGAPKLAAMEHLAALEGHGRGFFTGSLGFLDVRGEATFNILIRTLVWHALPGGSEEAEVEFHVGGGITWRSQAALEEEETRVKGAALAALLCGAGETPDTLGIDLPGSAASVAALGAPVP
jgi:anthranilate/para-aminobenzoate synthase component I